MVGGKEGGEGEGMQRVSMVKERVMASVDQEKSFQLNILLEAESVMNLCSRTLSGTSFWNCVHFGV